MQLINMRSGTKTFTAGQGIKQRSDFPRGLSNMPVCFQLTCPSFYCSPSSQQLQPSPCGLRASYSPSPPTDLPSQPGAELLSLEPPGPRPVLPSKDPSARAGEFQKQPFSSPPLSQRGQWRKATVILHIFPFYLI